MRETSRIGPADTRSYISEVEHIVGNVKEQLGDQIPALGCVVGNGVPVITEYIQRERAAFSLNDVPLIEKVVLDGVPLLMANGGCYTAGKHSMQAVTAPVRAMGQLGVSVLVVVNSAYSLAVEDRTEGLCLISDHINYFSNSPLVGHNVDEWGPRFPDMTEPYDVALRERCLKAAQDEGIRLDEKVLIALAESSRASVHAENRQYLKTLGADILSFDMVPEVIAARHMDMRVLGLSCLIDDEPDAEAVSGFIYPEEKIQSSVLTLLKAIASFI